MKDLISTSPNVYYVNTEVDSVKTGLEVHSELTDSDWGKGLIEGYVHRYDDIFDIPKPYLKRALENKIFSSEGIWNSSKFYYDSDEINKIFS